MTDDERFRQGLHAGFVWGVIAFAVVVSLTEAVFNFPFPMH